MTPSNAGHQAARGKTTVTSERRAEIGAGRRARSRAAILEAAFHLFGSPTGQNTRIEDICSRACIARGTFYNHFGDLEQLKHDLLDDLTREFDHTVHLVFDGLDGPAEQSAVAIRYYLHMAAGNPDWGRAIINSVTPGHIFGRTVWANVLQTVREGIEAGIFVLATPELGRDLLLGAACAATGSIVRGTVSPAYPEAIAEHILLAFGLPREQAHDYAYRPLPPLPPIAREMNVIAGMPVLRDIGG